MENFHYLKNSLIKPASNFEHYSIFHEIIFVSKDSL